MMDQEQPRPESKPSTRPLAWHYQRLLENQQALENDQEVQAFKEEWEQSPADQAF